MRTERPDGLAGNRATLSLSARLALGLSALLLVGGLALAFAALAYGRAAARDAFDRLLIGAASDIAGSIGVEDGRVRPALPVSAFELLALAPDDRIAYQVRDIDGAVLTGYADLPRPPNAEALFYDAAFLGEAARFIRVTRRFAERRVSGSVEVIVGQTLLARRALARDIARNALIGLAIGGLAMLLAAVLVVRSALRPLDRIAAQLAARDPQDLTPLPGRVPQEVAPLVHAVNAFMARLDRQFEALHGLISDTAHQLRTPVAALRAQADLAQRESDSARHAHLVERIHRRSVSLGRLLDQMLSRAMVIHRVDSVRRDRVDLRDIVLDILEADDHRMIAPQAEVRLDIGEGPVIVLADAVSLREAVKNLLTNALRHGTAPITLGTSIEDGHALIWVQDVGPGPGTAIRDQVGRRFVAQTSSDGPSSGLGLSIAVSVARAFGGSVQMRDLAGGFRAALVLERVA